jgi:hypothetical protein
MELVLFVCFLTNRPEVAMLFVEKFHAEMEPEGSWLSANKSTT